MSALQPVAGFGQLAGAHPRRLGAHVGRDERTWTTCATWGRVTRRSSGRMTARRAWNGQRHTRVAVHGLLLWPRGADGNRRRGRRESSSHRSVSKHSARCRSARCVTAPTRRRDLPGRSRPRLPTRRRWRAGPS